MTWRRIVCAVRRHHRWAPAWLIDTRGDRARATGGRRCATCGLVQWP